MHNLLRIMIYIVFALFLSYVLYGSLFWSLQRRVLFPRHLIALPQPQNMPELERVWLETSHGEVEAWFLAPLGSHSGAAPAVIIAHGNAELIDYWPQSVTRLRELGFGVLLVEYPGYGRSAGTPSQESITETFVAAYDMLAAREEVQDTRIVLMGRSLGGRAVCALAVERPTAALILLSTFTSTRSFASDYYVPSFLMRDPFDNLAVVTNYAGPVLVMHGKHDELIPYEHGQTLYRAAQQGHMVTYECGHNDCPLDEPFWQEVELFLHNAGIIVK